MTSWSMCEGRTLTQHKRSPEARAAAHGGFLGGGSKCESSSVTFTPLHALPTPAGVEMLEPTTEGTGTRSFTRSRSLPFAQHFRCQGFAPQVEPRAVHGRQGVPPTSPSLLSRQAFLMDLLGSAVVQGWRPCAPAPVAPACSVVRLVERAGHALAWRAQVPSARHDRAALRFFDRLREAEVVRAGEIPVPRLAMRRDPRLRPPSQAPTRRVPRD